MNQYHRLANLHFQDNWLVLTIDGEEKKYAIQEISPSGYGIHWPLLDEDLSVDGLLGIIHAPEIHSKRA